MAQPPTSTLRRHSASSSKRSSHPPQCRRPGEVWALVWQSRPHEEETGRTRSTDNRGGASPSGDAGGYAARIKHANDYTLMSPYGGEPVRGFDDSEAALAALARFFRGGEAELEVVETYTSGDLVVLVVIERQHGEVGGLPEQDWSLRVTWVFRRTAASDWKPCIVMRTRWCMPSTTSGWGC